MLKKYSTFILILVATVFASNHQGVAQSTPLLDDDKELKLFLPEIYENRRAELMKKVEGDIIVISNDDAHNFHYLTGFDQSPAVAIIAPGSDYLYILFLRFTSPTAVLWDGPRHTINDAIHHFGADTAHFMQQLHRKLAELVGEGKSISVSPTDTRVNQEIENIRLRGNEVEVFSDLKETVENMRVIKDPWEKEWLAQAVEVTCDAHLRSMKAIEPGKYEYEIRAEIEYVFMKNNCTTGFPSIIGSGPNATFLHYPFYDRKLQEGDLILIDIGAKCNHYTADVTRTYPVSGKFTPEQRELYELVLKAQEAAIEMMKPGVGTLEPHHRATEIIMDGLFELGLITDRNSWWQQRFYLHYAGLHYIGLHVHDPGYFADIVRSDRDGYLLDTEIKGRPMEPGMVLTIEPGLYFLEDGLDHVYTHFSQHADREELNEFIRRVAPVYERYKGIGIRIEDDILIIENGNVNLSSGAPKSVEEIEAVMRR